MAIAVTNIDGGWRLLLTYYVISLLISLMPPYAY